MPAASVMLRPVPAGNRSLRMRFAGTSVLITGAAAGLGAATARAFAAEGASLTLVDHLQGLDQIAESQPGAQHAKS